MAENIEWYMRIFDPKMSMKYKDWAKKIKELLSSFKENADGSLIIDKIHEILPAAPPDMKVPF